MTVTMKKKVATAPAANACPQLFEGLSTSLEAAQAYHNYGMAPVPVPHGSKKPEVKWSEVKCDSAAIPSLFAGQLNIAVKLGADSHGVVDIDLDTSEAIKLAPYFLLPTNCVFGRKSKPKSHWVYTVANPGKTIKWQAKCGQPDTAMLLELRSTGSLTVFPPSVHETGEQVRFEEGHAGLPTEISWLTLVDTVNKLAVATLLARAWPKTSGSRNELAMAFAGGMLRSGVPPKLVAKLLHRAAEAAGDTEADQRASVVGPTLAKIKNGEPTTGWSHAGELLGSEIAKEARHKCPQWLGLIQPGHSVEAGGGKLISTLASKVVTKAPEWFWPEWSAYGSVCVLDGDPGMGKSTLCLDLAARLSKGMNLPGGHTCKPGNVIVLSGEDSIASTIKPRLEAAGADCDRIRIIDGVLDSDGNKGLFSIPEHIEQLTTAILEDQARLVVIDPFMGYLSPKANAHSDQQVRRASA